MQDSDSKVPLPVKQSLTRSDISHKEGKLFVCLSHPRCHSEDLYGDLSQNVQGTKESRKLTVRSLSSLCTHLCHHVLVNHLHHLPATEIWATRNKPAIYLLLGKNLYSSHHLVLNIDKLLALHSFLHLAFLLTVRKGTKLSLSHTTRKASPHTSAATCSCATLINAGATTQDICALLSVGYFLLASSD